MRRSKNDDSIYFVDESSDQYIKIGTKFGLLTTTSIPFSERVKNKRNYYVDVRCACDYCYKIRLAHLRVGIISCGCSKRGKNEVSIGEIFGYLTVLGKTFVTKDKNWAGHTHVVLECRCGNVICTRVSNLKTSFVQSCGCKAAENRVNNLSRLTHGLSKTGLYKSYYHMIDRCYNENNKAYKYYGARGIKICEEWLNDFQSFAIWALGHGWKKGLTIDRIHNDGNYEPENCQWLTMSENVYKEWEHRRI